MAEILVVDDESAVREAIAALLEALGHHCVQAADGFEALEHLHVQHFDVILSDVLMPRMKGFQLLERLLPYIGERVPYIIVSSVKTQSEIQDALYAGAFDYLTKPCELEDLQEILDRALAHRRRHLPRGRLTGGCIPIEALESGRRAAETATLDKELLPSGIPVFRKEADLLAVAPPAPGQAAAREPVAQPEAEPSPPSTGLRGALRKLFGSRVRRKAG